MYYYIKTLVIALGITGIASAQSIDFAYGQGFHFGKYNEAGTYNTGSLYFIPDPDYSSSDYQVQIPKAFQSESFVISGILPIASRIGIRAAACYQQNNQYILTEEQTYQYFDHRHKSYGLNVGVSYIFINKPGIRFTGFYLRGVDYVDFGIKNLTPFQQAWLRSWGMKGFAMSHTFGAEAEFAVSEHFSMSFQLRYHSYNYSYNNNTTTGLNFRRIDNQIAPGISVRYHFGKEKLAPIGTEEDYFETDDNP